MKTKIIIIFLTCFLAVLNYTTCAQMYRATTTEALENNGKQWIEKKLPASVITFADYSGQVEIKTMISSLVEQKEDSLISMEPASTDNADFIMHLDKDQLPEQIAAAKTFTTTGMLAINNVKKQITAQYILEPVNRSDGGFTISVIIRFNPADFGIEMKGELSNEPLIVKVSGGYLNKQQNNF